MQQYQSGTILKSDSTTYPLIKHVAIVWGDKIIENTRKYGIRIVDFNEWRLDREQIEIAGYIEPKKIPLNLAKCHAFGGYDPIHFNCEHFVACMQEKTLVNSQQIDNWKKIIGLAALVFAVGYITTR